MHPEWAWAPRPAYSAWKSATVRPAWPPYKFYKFLYLDLKGDHGSSATQNVSVAPETIEHMFEKGSGGRTVDPAQVALKLFLDVLGVGPSVATIDERKSVQKAVYLGQVAGVDLGYRYTWYRMGPYSPGLTRAYFSLAGALASGAEPEVGGFELRGPVREKLEAVRPLFAVPKGVMLSQPDWLELLASVHFLVKQRRMSLELAEQTLKEEKTHVAPFLGQAVVALEDGGLGVA